MALPREVWPNAKIPAWMDGLEIPHRLAKTLALYTPHRDGFAKWYAGQSRVFCGKTTPLDQVDGRWQEKRKTIDQAAAGNLPVVRAAGITIIEAMARFYEYLDHRVTTNQPKPMSEYTAEDTKRYVEDFARLVMPDGDFAGVKLADRAVDDVGPDEFTAFAKTLAGKAPSTFARAVAYVRGFFAWCVEAGIIDAEPRYGPYFVRPAKQEHRDVRIGQKKAYKPDELVKILAAATVEEKAWIGMGLTGGMDNADLANLTFEVIDRKAKSIDYRRRKTGKMPRLIPLHTDALKWLDAYLAVRPQPADPANAGRVFLTPTGLPLHRMKESAETGKKNPIDYVSMCWGRLLVRAGIRPEPRRRRRTKADRAEPAPAKRRKGDGPGDGRGFRSLRHTFVNLAPRGYRDEVELILGHATGTVLLDNYLEEYGTKPLFDLVRSIFRAAFKSPPAARAASRVGGRGRRRGAASRS